MILDTSVVIAILKNEPDSALYAEAIENAPIRRISAVTLFEMGIIADRNENPALSHAVDDFVAVIHPIIEPVTEMQAKFARQAYREYGKGSGHPAQLNFGDCFSYAVAKDRDEPLLYKGNDFVHTDIRSES
ncbi:MAG: type II toxin-antitoxin system VapC family toxin [Thermomicrobiales bacterium]